MPDRLPTIFMTGATGFLGQYLLRDLLIRGCRVVVMLREPFGQSCRRLDLSLSGLGFDLTDCVADGRLMRVPGDLPDGIPSTLPFPVDAILSCAASLQLLSNGNQEPHRTNVIGTQRLIQWARRQGIKKIHAVSTAYVCGPGARIVPEVIHHPRPEFGTDYEHSKWLAESHLSDWAEDQEYTLTLFRPSFVVGDSQSGYTTQYGGFYQFARVLSLFKRQFGDDDQDGPTHVPMRIPGRADDPQNFVPVDFASRIIAEVVTSEPLQGKIYHLTDPTPSTNGQIKGYIEAYFRINGGQFVEPSEMGVPRTPAESLLWGQYEMFKPRITHTPRFDQNNTAHVCRTAGLVFPTMNRERFFTLMDYAVAHRWGQVKRRNVETSKRRNVETSKRRNAECVRSGQADGDADEAN